MINTKISSPLYKGGSVDKIETFNSKFICNAYKSMGLDVSGLFKGTNEITLYSCRNTGYRFYYPFTSIGDAEFYKDLSLKRKNYYSTRWEHLEILPKINKNDKVLEIGSGFGVFLKLLQAKNVEAEGIELNPEAVKTCEKEKLKIHRILIDEFSEIHPEQFDIVCYFQVLEHITNVHDFIKSSLKTLKSNGQLVIGVPNNNPYLFVNDKHHTLNLPPHHAGLWNKKSLKSLEKIYNIKLESVKFEPLEKTYSQFLESYISNSNKFYASIIKTINRVIPKLLKYLLCKFINGRNILVIYRK
ncbi:class I SAM-dependent methyltransferase [Gelidibacter sp. F2691]|nr:class I SAM-dependent methyltransferase [Gelidibacter sp. F2691]